MEDDEDAFSDRIWLKRQSNLEPGSAPKLTQDDSNFRISSGYLVSLWKITNVVFDKTKEKIQRGRI